MEPDGECNIQVCPSSKAESCELSLALPARAFHVNEEVAGQTSAGATSTFRSRIHRS